MPLRRCGSSASASTSSGRPSRRHPSPCDASVLAPGATRPTCALVTRALWPLEMVAIDAQCPWGAAFGDGGLQAPLRRGGCAACTKCALLSWRPPSVRSAVCARGHVRRMALVSQPSIRGHCSSGYLLERARVPADAAAVVVRRARVDAWVGDEVPMTLLRWRRVTAAAPTRCGRPLRGHASPCDAPVLASGATECRWRHCHRHRCPGRRARLPLGWLPSAPDSRVLPPPATEGHRRRGAEGGVHCLGRVRVIFVAAAVDAQCHVSPRGRVRRIATGVAAIDAGAPLERARVPADAAAVAIRRARADAWVGDEVPVAPLHWHRTTPRRPLDAVGRREDMRRRAMRQCWRLG